MNRAAASAAGWSGDLGSLLSVRAASDTRFVNCTAHELNVHGRVFGGQLLGQSISAATSTVAADRRPTVLQAVFLSGALAQGPIAYDVALLQDGKRFSSRRVLAMQGDRKVIEAHVSAMKEHEPHRDVVEAWVRDLPDPETLPTNDDLAPALQRRFEAAAYRYTVRPTIEFRFANPGQLFPRADCTRVQYWIRSRRAVGDAPAAQSAALAYLSDNWLTYAAVARRIALRQDDESLYVASLNHALWFHAPCRADEWLLVDAEGLDAGGGRGYTRARAFTRDGRLAISMAQECLLLRHAESD